MREREGRRDERYTERNTNYPGSAPRRAGNFKPVRGPHARGWRRVAPLQQHRVCQPRHLAASTAPTGPDWLGEINLYRKAPGLAPVGDQTAWAAAIDAHLKYLEKTPSSYLAGNTPLLTLKTQHRLITAPPARTKRLPAISLWELPLAADVQTIDAWLECPFHAVGMLRPGLTQVAYASLGDDAGLDVLDGLNEQSGANTQVLFPGPRMTTDLTNYCGDESPSPLQTCGWPDAGEGLPLIALLTSRPSGQLKAALRGPGPTMTSQNGALCIVDTATFKTTDAIYGPKGPTYSPVTTRSSCYPAVLSRVVPTRLQSASQDDQI